ncbi:MAG TPA: sigma factor [Trebonia sp.]|nr:sigma factor [Trebonia sp.]
MLGSLAEADDAVQDTWLRLTRSGTEGVENLGGWLTTIVARVCLNMLPSRDRRREEPLPAHGGQATREPGTPPGAGRRGTRRPRPRPPASGRGRVPLRRPPW